MENLLFKIDLIIKHHDIQKYQIMTNVLLRDNWRILTHLKIVSLIICTGFIIIYNMLMRKIRNYDILLNILVENRWTEKIKIN